MGRLSPFTRVAKVPLPGSPPIRRFLPGVASFEVGGPYQGHLPSQGGPFPGSPPLPRRSLPGSPPQGGPSRGASNQGGPYCRDLPAPGGPYQGASPATREAPSGAPPRQNAEEVPTPLHPMVEGSVRRTKVGSQQIVVQRPLSCVQCPVLC